MRSKSIPNKKKNNTKTTTTQKVVCVDEYEDLNLFEKTFITNKRLEELGRELVTWARTNPDALKLKQFYDLCGVGEKKFNEWCTKYPFLAEKRDHARMILGNRREIGALHRELDVGMVVRMMPKYDQDWDDMLVRIESLKSKDGGSGGDAKIICVGLEKFADCPEVKPLKDKADE